MQLSDSQAKLLTAETESTQLAHKVLHVSVTCLAFTFASLLAPCVIGILKHGGMVGPNASPVLRADG